MSIALSTRLFNPITGNELKQIIINEFTRALENSPVLQPHLTFDLTKYEIKFHLESYPMDSSIDIKVGRQIGNPDATGEPQVEDLTLNREIGSTQLTAPDKVREDNELPVPTKTRTDSGQIVDSPWTVTVGQGTKPRGRPVKAKTEVPAEHDEPTLGDDGEPVRINTGA